MPASFLSKSLEDAGSIASAGRLRYALLLGGFALCFLGGLAYHVVVWYSDAPPTEFGAAVYHVVIPSSYVLLWLAFERFLSKRRPTAISVFWTTILAGMLFFALSGLSWTIGPSREALFDADGYPLTLPTVLRMHLLSLLDLTFVFFLLNRLRGLVLFKRTRRSQRNWQAMLGVMVLASLFTFMKDPDSELGLLQGLVIVPAVVLMVMNAFRLSWIIYLSFKEKVICIGLTLVLLILLGAGLGSGGLLDTDHLRHYSHPLSLFATLSLTFGILYSTAALLSLLFHLPTTSDFQRKADEMAAMHSLTHLVSQAFDAEKLATSIAASPVEAGSAQASWLALESPQEGSLRPHVAATHSIERARVEELVDAVALYEEIRRTRAPLLLDEAPSDHRVRARPGDGLDSLLAVPLIARDALLGVLFATKDVMHGFEKDDVEAISMFAAQAALALDHAHLFEEQIERERLTRELDIAREVQRRLLPGCLPSVPGLSLCASSVSAQEVGGDYYDFIRLPDGRSTFIVADVSGKGTSAAFYMAEMQGIFQSGSRLAPAPADFLNHANEVLGRSLEKNVFISVVYGLIDPAREELVLARAGHCPVATINLHGDARFLRPQGLGLGLDPGPLFRQTLGEARIALQPGDAFVLYTDGVIESRSQTGEEYGYDRLLGALRDHRHEDASELHTALLSNLHTFIGHDSYDDDLTLVVMKWHGLELARLDALKQQAAPHEPAAHTATFNSG